MVIARGAEELAPEAWLVQITNSVFKLTTLLSREAGLKVIGLCYRHLGYKVIARAIGLP